MIEETPKHPKPTQYWFHRRTGFYIGVAWGILQTFVWIGLGLWSVPVLSAAGPVIAWSYGISIMLIILYYSNTLAEELVKRKSNW